MLQQIQETADYIQKRTNQFQPIAGIILGTGLGGLVKEIDTKFIIPYEEIPHFPVSTVEGHSGKLIFGYISNKPVMVLQGRFHYYEGYTMNQVVFPVRVMKKLGISTLFLSNASGGVNPAFEVGDVMILNDHINMLPSNPLLGPNIPELGPRFPDMSEPYDRELIARAKAISQKLGYKVHEGVYISVSGPCFETPAEYRLMRVVGGDAVGMSTVPEVIAARHMGLPCFAVSVITDLGVEGKIVEVTHEDVIKAASKAEVKMTAIFKDLLASL
ncbi:MAG: purine-nucleoside phosphorylase [Bacteroidia bacterium]|jgi:purine-nucleoside phosphorylase|nr:purine-nucleoside phosphorylase [Bacteroidia bacterium]MCC6767770.1 purine-nucleoside phosphorylase [Bacteroidia bacterium]